MWEGKSGILGPCPRWTPRQNPWWGLEAKPPEADDTFCERMLFCHVFKNDVATFAFTAYKCINVK